MSVVRNSFTHTLSSTAMATHNIVGLNSASSNNNIGNVNAEASLYFLKAIYQTLIDAGYADTTMNETEYSITVLGFKFYALVRSSSTSWVWACPCIFTHHKTSDLSLLMGVTTSSGALNANSGSDLAFNIMVRGDGENVVAITLGAYATPDTETPLLFVAKATNLMTSEDAFLFGNQPVFSANTAYLRNKNSLYTYYESVVAADCTTYFVKAGLNTASKIIRMPVFAYFGSFLVKGLIQCNATYFTKGKYYQIGDEMYHVLGPSGLLLMKIS